MVIAHFENRATGPLRSIAGENNAYTGQLGHIVKVQRLVTEVIHCSAGHHPLVVVVGISSADSAEAIEDFILSHIVAIAETRMEGQRGHKTVRSP